MKALWMIHLVLRIIREIPKWKWDELSKRWPTDLKSKLAENLPYAPMLSYISQSKSHVELKSSA